MDYKKLIASISICLFSLGLASKGITAEIATSTLATQKACKKQNPKRKYLASLTLNSFTLCDNSGCETEEAGGLTSNNSETNYFLSALSARNGSYTYYLLDRKTFREYQVTLIPECGQFTFSLPISLNPGVADTDTVEMKCVGLVAKNGAVFGDCEGSFFHFGLNGDFTMKGPFTLAPTKQTIINPCNTAAGILIYGTQCSNR